VLADEINRATPKTQSALLEAMQEHTVTSGNTTHKLDLPFLVMATQNPIEMEGTYPLPEAQLDRFLMKILVTLSEPQRIENHRGADRGARRGAGWRGAGPGRSSGAQGGVPGDYGRPHVMDYAIQLVMATQPDQPEAHEAAKEVHPFRRLTARRAGAGGMRPGVGLVKKPLPSECGRY